jgi:hypothetical protein
MLSRKYHVGPRQLTVATPAAPLTADDAQIRARLRLPPQVRELLELADRTDADWFVAYARNPPLANICPSLFADVHRRMLEWDDGRGRAHRSRSSKIE